MTIKETVGVIIMSQAEYNTIKHLRLNGRAGQLTIDQGRLLIAYARGQGRAVRYAIFKALEL